MKRNFSVYFFVAFIALSVLSTAYASVRIESNPNSISATYKGHTAPTAKAIVPAERTQKIGAGKDGEIVLNGERAISWTAGANYDIADVLQMWINPKENAEFLPGGGWVFVAAPFTATVRAGAHTYAYRWTTLAKNAAATASHMLPFRHLYTVDGTGFTVPVGIASKLTSGAKMFIYADPAADNMDVSNVTGEKVYNVLGRAVRGGIPIDVPPASTVVNQILETIYQYSYTAAVNRPGSVVSTIDAINHQARLFQGSTAISNPGSFTVYSEAFNVISYAPTFIANDSLVVTLTGDHAFQGMDNVIFGGLATFTRAVGAATNSAAFTFSNTDLLALAPGAGRSNVDLPFVVSFEADGTSELVNRVVSASAQLRLAGTGNGNRDLGSWGNLLTFRQNGTLFRLGRLRTATAQETYVRFSSTANVDTNVDVRFYYANGTATAWARYGTAIPSSGSMSIDKAALMALLSIGVDEDGFVEFRLHTAIANVVAVCQAKMGTTGWVNIPVYFLDVNAANADTWR